MLCSTVLVAILPGLVGYAFQRRRFEGELRTRARSTGLADVSGLANAGVARGGTR